MSWSGWRVMRRAERNATSQLWLRAQPSRPPTHPAGNSVKEPRGGLRVCNRLQRHKAHDAGKEPRETLIAGHAAVDADDGTVGATELPQPH